MKGEWPTSWFYQYDHYDYWIGKTVNLISIKKLTYGQELNGLTLCETKSRKTVKFSRKNPGLQRATNS